MANKIYRTSKSTGKIISALKELIKKWAKNIPLRGNEQLIETKLIHYLQGISQRDRLYVLLFILCVSTLSFLLNKLQRHQLSLRPKHCKLFLYWWFVVTRNNPESSETTIRPSHSVFQRHWYEIWWVKMRIYGNWKGRNHWRSRIYNNEWLKYKPNENWWVLRQDENILYVGPINKARVTKE